METEFGEGDFGENILSEIGANFSSGKVEFSKPACVMIALMDCRKKRSVEMKAGFVQERLDRQGNAIRTFIPDARREYIASVDSLKILLAPECKADKNFKEEEEKILEKKKKLFEKNAYREYSFKEEEYGEYKNSRYKYYIPKDAQCSMPSLGSSVNLLNRDATGLIPVKGGWDSHTENYLNEMVFIYDEFLSELNILLSNLGYFKKRAKIN